MNPEATGLPTGGEFKVRAPASPSSILIGRLVVEPLSSTDHSAPGQWMLEFEKTSLTKERSGLPAAAAAHLMARLGVHPVGFSEAYRKALLAREAMATVFDTSAVIHGGALHAARTRHGKPTRLVLPDQAFMEMQAQREDHTLARDSSQSVQRHLNESLAPRTVRRLRAAGTLVDFIRPPEPMVRYLGSNSGAPTGDEGDWVAASGGEADVPKVGGYVRDRLVLEAARQLRQRHADEPVWLLTGDHELFVHASVEGFNAALCWVPKLAEPARYTSPFFSPHDLRLWHVPLSSLVADLVWAFGGLELVPDTGAAWTWHLPSDKRGRALKLVDASPIAGTRKAQASTPPPAAADSHGLTRTAPTPQGVVADLLAMASGGPADTLASRPYLVALGWVSDTGLLTPRGQEVAALWTEVGDATKWCDWMEMVAQDVGRLPLISQLTGSQPPGKWPLKQQQISKLWKMGDRSAESQLVFAGTLGAVVRLGGKTWAPHSGDAATALLQGVQAVLSSSGAGSSAAPAERVFTYLLRKTPLPLHVFRRAVLRLREEGRIALTGAVAESSDVKVRTLVRDEQGQPVAVAIDLAAGDFLVPGVAGMDLKLAGGAT